LEALSAPAFQVSEVGSWRLDEVLKPRQEIPGQVSPIEK
jgi:hypothetical protein